MDYSLLLGIHNIGVDDDALHDRIPVVDEYVATPPSGTRARGDATRWLFARSAWFLAR
jgi:hypothetical protein